MTKRRICQIEQGKISGQDTLARYAAALVAGCTNRSTSRTGTLPPSPDSGSEDLEGGEVTLEILGDSETMARIGESLNALRRGEAGADLATVRDDVARRSR
ncbi:hypothetical protein [Amycolatopsis alkalitolerans]|uniref:hypothetical protein n=1 Tax=Amycolatopsis alkalitolerans TaxID=2547244 RepID=UPI00190F8077|nr:hypothetical protein [Amycolatopsis alkalitolerans]